MNKKTRDLTHYEGLGLISAQTHRPGTHGQEEAMQEPVAWVLGYTYSPGFSGGWSKRIA